MTQPMSLPDKQRSGILSRGPLPNPLKIAIGLCALLVATLPAYFQIFFRFSKWDDEGFLLATVKAVLQGHVLYDQIYTLYGPFYYLVEWIFYAATGLPASHDCVRSIALVLWVVSSLILAYSAYRVTASLLAGGFALVAMVEVLIFFDWEPGHPEEVCMLLLACFIALLCTASGRLSRARMAGLGFLVAALAQTKINLGLFAAFGLLLTLLATRAGGRRKDIWLAVGGVASLGFLTRLAMPVYHLPWARNYFWLVILSCLPILLMNFFTESHTRIDRRAWWVLVLTFVGSWCAIVVPFLARGGTLSALLYVTIFQHEHFARHWFKPTPVNGLAVLWSIFSLAISIFWLWTVGGRWQQRAFRIALHLLKAALGLFVAVQLLAHRVDWPVGYQIMMVVAPFTWLILVPPASETDKKQLTRIGLAFTAVFVDMYSFPVGGSQNLFSIVPLIIVAAVFLRDAESALFVNWPRLSDGRLRLAGSALGLLAITASYARDLHHAYRVYEGGVPLALPGSAHIRVPQADAETYAWLTRTLNARCPSFFSMPGLFSLYFWTRQDFPTLLIINDWPAFFDAAQQHMLLDDLVRHSTACIVYNPDLVKFWSTGEDQLPSPVGDYMRSAFVPIDQRDGYYIMRRKDAMAAVRR